MFKKSLGGSHAKGNSVLEQRGVAEASKNLLFTTNISSSPGTQGVTRNPSKTSCAFQPLRPQMPNQGWGTSRNRKRSTPTVDMGMCQSTGTSKKRWSSFSPFKPLKWLPKKKNTPNMGTFQKGPLKWFVSCCFPFKPFPKRSLPIQTKKGHMTWVQQTKP